MSLTIFKDEPHFDDFNESKNYLRVLFRPGVSLQVRELNQLQTYLQTQIERLGLHLFKDGAMVIPGQSSLDMEITYVKLEALTVDSGLEVATIIGDLNGATVTGLTTGVTARIATTSVQNDAGDPNTLFIRYTASGTDTVTKTFNLGEVLTVTKTTTDADGVVTTTSHNVQIQANNALGLGAIASIERGIYFVKGQFTLVESDTIIISKYDNKPSCRIGLMIDENVVDASIDDSLNDNANGAPNENAPGAYRYQILLSFTQLPIDSTDTRDFIELIRVDTGTIQSRVTETDYSILNKTLARRTYDESGHYTVSPFKIAVREHRNNNRGPWVSGKTYLIGDIVTFSGNYFTALNSGVAGSNDPSLLFDPSNPYPENSISDGTVKWSYSKSPAFNRGYLTPEKDGDENYLAVAVEPGKAYVQGYEVEKISTEYVKVPKARMHEYITDDAIPINYGNYILVTNVHGLLDCGPFPKVSLYDQLTRSTNPQTTGSGTLVGHARARALEFHSGVPGTSTGVYRLYLFDIEMVSTAYTLERNVKQVFFNTGTTITNVTADVTGVYTTLSGLITATSASTTVNGSAGPAFDTQLKVGDYIRTTTSAGVEQRRVTAIANASQLTIEPAFSGTFSTPATFQLVKTAIVDPGNLPLLFPLAYSFIRSVRASNDTDSSTKYTTTQRFDGQTQAGTTLTLSITSSTGATTAGKEFNPAATSVNSWLVFNTTDGVIASPSGITFSPNTNEQEVVISGLTANKSYTVFAPVRKREAGAREKTKTLKTNQVKDFTSLAEVSSIPLSLKKADVYRIVAILMSPAGTWTATSDPTAATDITSWFTFDDGQRDTHYDVAKIIRKDGYPVPTGAVRVIFDYFDHSQSTAGDYFTVNSYKDLPYHRIPYYNSSTGVVALADVMDFRPRIDDDGLVFDGSNGSSKVELPKIGFETSTSYSYYLPRSDKLALSPDGQFFTIEGVASLTPEEPKDPAIGMMIAKLRISAYTMYPSNGSVAIETIDNRRYTMRDIGKLDRRIETLEYYTSLSLLEQETKSLSIPDPDGIDRFKNGFIVDSFKGQDLGDVSSIDYSCAIDMSAKELRPFYTMNNVNLLEGPVSSTRAAAGYALTGDIITLPYTEKVLIKQPFASRTENVNPFAIFTFLGSMTLNPPSDEWFEVNRRPDIINNVEGNFNAVQSQLQAKGVLGTVWGAWETQWVGQTQNIDRLVVTTGFDKKDYGLGAGKWSDRRTFTQAELEAIGGNATSLGQDGVGKRVLTFSTPATETIQGRVGVTTTVTPRIDYQVVEDRILQTALIPYIRSRELLFVCKGMRPNAKLHPFFDDTDITTFVTPATKINIIDGNGKTFNTDTNVGGDAEEVSRQVATKAEVAYNKGDVVYVKTRNGTLYNSQADSPVTAVAVLTEKSAETEAEAVYVLNIRKGAFQVGDVIKGSISGAEYTISETPTVMAQGGNLVSNFNGSLAGVFSIPNTESIRFRTGIREFKLTDSATGGIDFTTQGRGQYRAQGVLETKQKTINAVRNADVSVQPVSETRPWTVYGDEVLTRDTGWYDPLAQTFLVQSKGGSFITSVDVFFATKDVSIPVNLQIREVVNGYPGQKILPFSRVSLTPDKISVDPTGTENVATKFTFESPVYLQDNVEYCLVLLSDSNNYRVWIAQLGERNVGLDTFITEQPYAGVLFKSQNASTWTANQEQDLKFTIHAANFQTAAKPAIKFYNEPLPAILLESDPFRTTAGSSKVRVYTPNHAMTANSSVSIRGVETNIYNGINTVSSYVTPSGLNGDYPVISAERDSFVIDVGQIATASGFVGGSTAVATINIAYDAVNLIATSQTFNDTTLAFDMTPTNETYNAESTAISLVPNITTYLDNPYLVASQVNKTKSMDITARLTSDNPNVSPVIDTSRLSMITIKNKIDTYTVANKNDLDIDVKTAIAATSGTAISFSGKVISVADTSNFRAAAKSIAVGKYIYITGTGSSTNNIASSSPALVTAVAVDGSTITTDHTFTTQAGTTANIIVLDNYVSDISPYGSSSESKYVTRVITLAKPSTFLKVMFAANVPSVAGTDIQVWYKLLPTGSTTDISQFNYIQATSPVKPITKTANANTFYDIEYDLKDLPAFDALAVKLVFKSGNSAKVPRVKDLRIIACA